MIEIITIGDELTSGSTVDENARFIAQALHSIGLSVSKITTVGDGIEDIQHALKSLLKETRFVIATGGLGPTEDDRTAKAAASAFGRQLLLNQEALNLMKKKFKAMQRKINPANRKQAVLPKGCSVVPNPVGTACGFLIEDGQRHFIFLPGVPEEVRTITENFLVEHLRKAIGSKQVILNRTLKVFGLWESAIHERLSGALPESRAVSLAYYPQYPEIRLKMTGKGANANQLQKEMDKFQKVIYEKIGDYVYSDSGESLEEVVGNLLKANNATLAVAESCTGGLITHRLTNISGSSQYLERSFVAYSNRAKAELLNVPSDVIQEFGAVSESVARFMAKGARELSGTTFGLAVTGIAGPTGGSPEKPVGTVFIGVSSDKQTEVKHHRFHGSREKIKMMSAHMALNLLRNFIIGKSIG